ncbi:MAG: threonine ammonia-lyase [Desulfurococcales archaeon]|nr:threonine ammonia-lyase [Desulfurococcales archaeon]
MGLEDEVYKLSLKARQAIAGHTRRTPLDYSSTFSRLAGFRVFLKYENLQKTGSFKVRGALFKVSSVKDRARGVVAASAGNHAQGVAYAASVYGVEAVIVMPETASISKVEATRGYGARVILHGSIYDEAYRRALEIAEEEGFEFIHPFDDPHVIAGQATIAHEVLEDLDMPETIVVPVGGGGLISGIAVVAKRLRPGIRVIGVEPENAPKYKVSLREGRPVDVEVKPTIADGLAVKRPGETTFKIISRLVDDIVTVSEEEIAEALYMLLERGKVLAEGAGAAPLAAVLSGKIDSQGDAVVIVSGGNIDLNMMYRVLLRGLSSKGRIASISGYVPDTPGTLHRVTGVIARHRGNIIDVIHERTDYRAPAWHTRIKIIVEVPSREALGEILRELASMGYELGLEE